MSIILFLTQIYLATILVVSGLAKVVDLETFAATLRRQGILPVWGIRIVSQTMPWLEIALALFLVIGIFTVFVNVLTLTLFVSFLIIEAILVKTNRAKECGCYGAAYRRHVDSASLVVASMFVLLAGFNLWGAMTFESIDIAWRISIGSLFGVGAAWLGWKALTKLLRLRNRHLSGSGWLFSPQKIS